MTDLERSIVSRKLGRILENVGLIRRAASLSISEWTADRDRHDATLYRLQICIEASIDINAHLLVEAGLSAPASGYASFLDLCQKLPILTPELAAALAPSASLRNRLVHRYDDLDEVMAVSDAVTHFPAYVDAIARFLDSRPG